MVKAISKLVEGKPAAPGMRRIPRTQQAYIGIGGKDMNKMKEKKLEPIAALAAAIMLSLGMALCSILAGCSSEPDAEAEVVEQEAEGAATEAVRQSWREAHGYIMQPGQFVLVSRCIDSLYKAHSVYLDLNTGALYLRFNYGLTAYLDSEGEPWVLEGEELEAWRQAAIEDGTWDPAWATSPDGAERDETGDQNR